MNLSLFIESIPASDWPALAAVGGLFVLVGLALEKGKDAEWFKSARDSRWQNAKAKCGWWLLMVGILLEIIIGSALAWKDEQENKTVANHMAKIDPENLPILNINAFVKIQVKGNVFPDLTQWDSIPLSTNWGSKRATLTFCGNAPNNILSSSIPTMIADDFGIGTGFSDFREHFLNFRMESVSAAMNLPLQSASKSLGAAKFISIDAKFLPPQSEVLDGYAFVVVNNSVWKLFRIYPQKDSRPAFPNKAQAEFLSKISPPKMFEQFVITGTKDAVSSSKLITMEPGKLTSLTNGEIFPVEATFFPADFVIIGTNVPAGKLSQTGVFN